MSRCSSIGSVLVESKSCQFGKGWNFGMMHLVSGCWENSTQTHFHKRDVAKNGEVVRCFATGGIGLMLLQLHGQEVAMVRSNRTVFTVYPCFRVSGLLVRAQAFCALATNSSAILVIKGELAFGLISIGCKKGRPFLQTAPGFRLHPSRSQPPALRKRELDFTRIIELQVEFATWHHRRQLKQRPRRFDQ